MSEGAIPAKTPIKVCVITAARSEYGLMRWLMQDLKDANDFVLQTIVTGMHLSQKHGLTYREIEKDGFGIDAKIPIDLEKGSAVALTVATGHLMGELSHQFDRLKPDIVLVMGDRYELLAVLGACVLGTIPIAHISGGEITEGAIDDQIRHAMTKSSHLHFVANDTYGARVRQMGEESWRICVSGEPGLENLYRQPMMSRDELGADLGIDLSRPTALVTYHSVTLEQNALADQMAAIVEALEQPAEDHGLQYIITYPNADAGFDLIVDVWKRFIQGRKDRVFIKSLGQTRYLTALRNVSMMIGNSSSGLVEAPSFALPVVNIGNRQGGRMRGRNVKDTGYAVRDILEGIAWARVWDRNAPCPNPYGDGRSSAKVLEHLREAFRTHGQQRILSKRFDDVAGMV